MFGAKRKMRIIWDPVLRAFVVQEMALGRYWSALRFVGGKGADDAAAKQVACDWRDDYRAGKRVVA
jgi:hypothetical protein